MKLSRLSLLAQDGLCCFCRDVHQDEMLLDAISSIPEQWAWIVFQLRIAPDRPEWFPKGKWATIQVIEEDLNREAAAVLARGLYPYPPEGGVAA